MMRLGALLMLSNAGADFIKDLLFNREPEWEDYVIDNLLRLFGLSRYMAWYAREEGVANTIVKLFAPPLAYLEAPGKDLQELAEATIGRDWSEWSPKDWETLKLIPVVGKSYYWWLGAGSEKRTSRTGARKRKRRRPVRTW